MTICDPSSCQKNTVWSIFEKNTEHNIKVILKCLKKIENKIPNILRIVNLKSYHVTLVQVWKTNPED
jgi:hypothetical protein